MNVLSMIGEAVEKPIDVNVSCWIDKRPCGSNYVLIVSFAFEIDLNVLHVCFPVDLCVC